MALTFESNLRVMKQSIRIYATVGIAEFYSVEKIYSFFFFLNTSQVNGINTMRSLKLFN
jgi:hypothetical protein